MGVPPQLGAVPAGPGAPIPHGQGAVGCGTPRSGVAVPPHSLPIAPPPSEGLPTFPGHPAWCWLWGWHIPGHRSGSAGGLWVGRGRTGGVRTHFPKSCPKPSAAAGMSRALRAHQPRTARSQALSDTSQLLEIAGFFAFFGVFLTSSSPFPGVFSAPWDEQRGLLGLSRSRPTGHPRDPFTRRAPLSRHRECPAPSLSSCFAFPFPWLGSGHPTPWSAGTPPRLLG